MNPTFGAKGKKQKMTEYKVIYEYYSGMGDNAIFEQVINKEQLLEVLNNVFTTDIMISAMKIYKLNPNGEYYGMIDANKYTFKNLKEID